MSTWELEYLGTAAAPASDRRELLAWGFSALDLDSVNWACGQLVLTKQTNTAFVDDADFVDGGHLVVWRDGSRVWHGWHVRPERQLTAPAEAITYTFADAWYWLQKHHPARHITTKDITYTTVDIPLNGGGTLPMQRASGCTWVPPVGGDIVWTDWDDQSTLTAQGQIRRALYSAIWAGAPIAIGTIDIDMPAPEQSYLNATCEAWAQSAARYSPLCVQWWDNSGTLPTFHCVERASATAYSHALSASVEAAGIAPIYDLQAFAIRLRYWTENEWTHFDDTAGDDGRPEGPGTLLIDVTIADGVNAAVSKWRGIAAKMFAALSALPWSGQLTLHEAGSMLPWYRPGHALNFTGGRTEWTTMDALVQQVSHHVTAESTDTCSITLGAPSHLSVQDWFELGRIGGLAGEVGEAEEPTTTGPGTLGDLGSLKPTTFTSAGGLKFEKIDAPYTLCGWPTYTTSSPERFFGSRALSGSVTRNMYAGGTCGGAPSTTRVLTWGGTATKGISTGVCVKLTDGTETSSLGGTTAVDNTGSGSLYAVERTTTLTETSARYDALGACYDNGNSTSQIQTGYALESLGNEATDDSALADALAAQSWATTTITEALWKPRATGAVGGYTKIRFKPSGTNGITGCKPFWPYTVTVRTEQAAINDAGTVTGSWSDAETISKREFSSFEGYLTFDWVEITAPRGYKVRIKLTGGVDISGA